MKILTAYDPPPIPLRQFDWSAWDDDRGANDGAAYGRTEEEAIAELLVMVAERDDEPDPDALREDRLERQRLEREYPSLDD